VFIASRQGSTKDKIVKLIADGNNTLSGMAATLDLAPSTISKHLDDLEYAGVIEQQDNPHIKKWKYYKLAQNNGQGKFRGRWFGMDRSRMVLRTIAVVLTAFIVVLYLYTNGANGSTYVPIGITDPPQVPYGTQALYINYSSVMAHVNSNGRSDWVPINASGRLDLMGLINESQIVGGLRIGPNSTIDKMEFNITSASIVIGNVTYAIYLTSNQVTAKLDGSRTVNSSSGILVDFSPIVTETYVKNSTVFVMIPSLTAVIISDSGFGPKPFSSNYANAKRYPLSNKYWNAFSSVNNNLTVSNVMLYSGGNNISFTATLHNNGVGNVTVLGMAINGDYELFSIANVTSSGGIVTLNVNGQSFVGGESGGYFGFGRTAGLQSYGIEKQIRFRVYQQSGSNVMINGSALYLLGTYIRNRSISIKLQNPTENISISGFNPSSSDFGSSWGAPQTRWLGFGFIVNENGTLSLPESEIFEHGHGPIHGYVLGSHGATIFRYSGNPGPKSFVQNMNLSGRSNYTVLVVTNEGVVRANVAVT
jgi:DNA-binding transcriptional ArsR family regulator